MITFTFSLLCLLLGYLLYGAVVERVVAPRESAKMPCYEKQDGVDYMPMPAWRVFLIQFLNIAGTGPIFGAIMGILFGPLPICGLSWAVSLQAPSTTTSAA